MELSTNPGIKAMGVVLKLLEQRNMTKSDLARSLNLETAYISNWVKRGLPADRYKSIADALNVSIDVIAGRAEQPDGAIPITLNGSIPVIGYARLGDDGFYDLCQIENDGELTIPSKDQRAYALRCEGTSMVPRIQPGEFVIAEPSFEAQPGDEVVVQADDGRVMVKRYLYKRSGYIYLGSVNTEQATITLDINSVRAIHPVLAIVPKKFLR